MQTTTQTTDKITMKFETTDAAYSEWSMVGNYTTVDTIHASGLIETESGGRKSSRNVGPIDLVAVQRARAAMGWSLV